MLNTADNESTSYETLSLHCNRITIIIILFMSSFLFAVVCSIYIDPWLNKKKKEVEFGGQFEHLIRH